MSCRKLGTPYLYQTSNPGCYGKNAFLTLKLQVIFLIWRSLGRERSKKRRIPFAAKKEIYSSFFRESTEGELPKLMRAARAEPAAESRKLCIRGVNSRRSASLVASANTQYDKASR